MRMYTCNTDNIFGDYHIMACVSVIVMFLKHDDKKAWPD